MMLGVPGAMEAGLDTTLFWGGLSVALAIAGAVAFGVDRWLIAHGKGHAAVHRTGIHGGPSPSVVGAIAVVAFLIGASVLAPELFGSDEAAVRDTGAAQASRIYEGAR